MIKRSTRLAGLALVILFAALFSRCHKFIDPDDLLEHPDKIPKLVKLKKISFEESEFTHDTAVFRYNRNDDPTAVIFLNGGGTGRPHLLFRYDNRRRLADYIGAFGTENNYLGYHFWHHFTYDGKFAVSDTIRYTARFHNGNPDPNAEMTEAEELFYDAKDRLIKTVKKNLTFPYWGITIEEYVYDAQGNLSRIRSTVNGIPRPDKVFPAYNNKLNIRRTHPVWLFVTRNYSLNDHITADKYSKYGLPLLYDPTFGGTFLYNLYLNKAAIEYQY